MNTQKLRDMNLHAVADELEQLREFKAEVESQEPVWFAEGDLYKTEKFAREAIALAGGSYEPRKFYEYRICSVPADKPARITEKDAREIAESCLAYWLYKHPMEFHVGDWLSTRGRELLNKLNADRAQVLDDTSAQRLWDYYQTLLKHYGFEGITDLLSKYHKLVEQVPAVSVPGDHEAIDTASLRKGFGTAKGKVEQMAAYHAALNACCDEIDRLRSKVVAAPSHSQQSAQGTTSAESREDEMVVIERDSAGTPTVWCDPEIVDLVTALNKAGIRTVASCSGHGYRPGNIALADGRELVIARTFEEAREIDQLFLTDINGNRCPSHESERADQE